MIVLLQSVLAGVAILLAIWVRMPWLGIGGLVLLGTGAILASARISSHPNARRIHLTLVFAGTLLALAGHLFSRNYFFTPDAYYFGIAWLVAAVLFLARREGAGPNTSWKLLTVAWLFLGPTFLLLMAYSQNRPVLFYGALALQLFPLVLAKYCFRLPLGVTQFLNVLILLGVALPFVDLLAKPAYLLDRNPDPAKKYYSFEIAHKDPSAYVRWWRYYLRQWDVMARDLFIPDPSHTLPFRLRPNGAGQLMNSRISINSRGFRGKEILAEKGDAYRIIALGESTTFGVTLNREDRPWPEILEDMIRERLRPARRVEVINAGVPAYILTHNLSRLSSELLPLKPDLIISYHGYNGLHLLRDAVPKSDTPPPPAYAERPLKLLANLEYVLKVRSYQHGLASRPHAVTKAVMGPNDTPYAQAYDELIRMTQTNGVRLAIGNFSMAINSHSSPEVIEFYRGGFTSVHWQFRANEIHSEIVSEAVAAHPGVSFIDMHPHLDGESAMFIDLVHLTQAGRQQAAENVFAGLRKILEQDLANPPAPILKPH